MSDDSIWDVVLFWDIPWFIAYTFNMAWLDVQIMVTISRIWLVFNLLSDEREKRAVELTELNFFNQSQINPFTV